MGLKNEKGIRYKIDELWFKIKENMLYSDIQDIKAGIETLKNGSKHSKYLYMQECKPVWSFVRDDKSNYTVEEKIKVLELLLIQKKVSISMRRKHKDQLHELNKSFTN